MDRYKSDERLQTWLIYDIKAKNQIIAGKMGKYTWTGIKLQKRQKFYEKGGNSRKKAEIKPSMRQISRENGVDVTQKPCFGKI